VAKHKSGLNQELTVAIASLMRFAPYSTSMDFKVWKDTMKSLREVQACLEILDAMKPGLLNVLLDDAYEEARIATEPSREISALIGRYCSRREPMR
jgi:hypothetical protein